MKRRQFLLGTAASALAPVLPAIPLAAPVKKGITAAEVTARYNHAMDAMKYVLHDALLYGRGVLRVDGEEIEFIPQWHCHGDFLSVDHILDKST